MKRITLEFGHELTKGKLAVLSQQFSIFSFLTFMAVLKQFNFCGTADGIPRNTG